MPPVGTFAIVYRPPSFVIAAYGVPNTVTVAPGTGCPFERSFTTPLRMVRPCCADAALGIATATSATRAIARLNERRARARALPLVQRLSQLNADTTCLR